MLTQHSLRPKRLQDKTFVARANTTNARSTARANAKHLPRGLVDTLIALGVPTLVHGQLLLQDGNLHVGLGRLELGIVQVLQHTQTNIKSRNKKCGIDKKNI